MYKSTYPESRKIGKVFPRTKDQHGLDTSTNLRAVLGKVSMPMGYRRHVVLCYQNPKFSMIQYFFYLFIVPNAVMFSSDLPQRSIRISAARTRLVKVGECDELVISSARF